MIKQSIGYTMIQKIGHMPLKGVNWVHNDKIDQTWSWNSQLCTQWKNKVKWYWKESVGYTKSIGEWKVHNEWNTMMKLVQMVLKGVNWVHNDKIMSNGLERSQLGTQW